MGGVPREQRPWPSQWAGGSTSTSESACSGLQPPDLQRQAPGGGDHQVALCADLGGQGWRESGALWAAGRGTQGRALPHSARCCGFGCRWSSADPWAHAPGEGQWAKVKMGAAGRGGEGGGPSRGLTRMVLSVDVVYKAPSECLIPVI